MNAEAMNAEALVGTEWKIEAVEGRAVPEGIEATLSFLEPGRIAGLAACNRYTGGIELDGGRIVSLGPLATTRMMCPPERMEQEQRVLEALSRARRLRSDAEALLLFGEGDGPPLLRMVPHTREAS